MEWSFQKMWAKYFYCFFEVEFLFKAERFHLWNLIKEVLLVISRYNCWCKGGWMGKKTSEQKEIYSFHAIIARPMSLLLTESTPLLSYFKSVFFTPSQRFSFQFNWKAEESRQHYSRCFRCLWQLILHIQGLLNRLDIRETLTMINF